ncbi:MAG: RNA 2'-phosphotransferase [Candidatus Heimdallarchaeota archaeon]|nr:RNA 2'-phosphotransferase [Candidatus Heimdallarchaeota archaeon]MDH5646316.1 RNA 2'-phosphotransferase [Candidatus Heimdallarchaeota archaeon]
MSKPNFRRKSKFLSLVLRHKPEVIGIEIDSEGWADLDAILKGVDLTLTELEELMTNDDKQRYSFNQDKTKIRANQGHSLKVEIKFEEKTPPDILFHGTSSKFVDLIMNEGLKSMERHHVHLSQDLETAKQVGSRRGKYQVLIIDTKQMMDDGMKFYLSKNNVWLTEFVDPKYISI